MTDKTQNFDGNAVEGHMLPTTLPSGPTSDPRTDAQILADAQKAAAAPYTFRSFREKDPVETYSQYLKRVEGLVDFTSLTEDAWRKETHQKTKEEEMLIDLGILGKSTVPIGTPLLDQGIVRQAPTGPMSTEEVTALEEMLGLNQPGNMASNTVPDVVYPAKLQTPVLTEQK